MTAVLPNLNSDFVVNGSSSAALVVDVHIPVIGFMEPEDARAYLNALGKYLEERRVQNKPIIWITTGMQKTLSLPSDPSSQKIRSEEDLHALSFYSNTPKSYNPVVWEIFHEFIRAHGPRENEAVYRKVDYDAFEGHNGPLKDYMHGCGYTDTEVTGGVTNCCVLETDMGATLNGFNSKILIDLAVGPLSWETNASVTWRAKDQTAGAAMLAHAQMIKEEYTYLCEEIKRWKNAPEPVLALSTGRESSNISPEAAMAFAHS